MHGHLYTCTCVYVHTPFHFMWVYMCFPHTCTCRMPYCVRPLYSPGPSCRIRGIEEGSHLTGRDKFHKMHEVLTCTHYHSVAESVFLVLQVSNTCVVCCSCVSVCCALHSPILQLHSPTHLSLSAVCMHAPLSVHAPVHDSPTL